MDTIRMLLVAGCSVASVPAARAQTDLLGGIDEGRVRAWVTRDATVFRDPGAGSITMTFRPVAGEPEVRVSTRSMGWPSDWSRYGALAFRFHATSLEPVSIGFSDGSVTKAMILEPLEGIRIQAVIPLQSFTQTRTMTPLLPLGYKAWPAAPVHVREGRRDRLPHALPQPAFPADALRPPADRRRSGRRHRRQEAADRPLRPVDSRELARQSARRRRTRAALGRRHPAS